MMTPALKKKMAAQRSEAKRAAVIVMRKRAVENGTRTMAKPVTVRRNARKRKATKTSGKRKRG